MQNHASSLLATTCGQNIENKRVRLDFRQFISAKSFIFIVPAIRNWLSYLIVFTCLDAQESTRVKHRLQLSASDRKKQAARCPTAMLISSE
jgi:hypothetical protein